MNADTDTAQSLLTQVGRARQRPFLDGTASGKDKIDFAAQY